MRTFFNSAIYLRTMRDKNDYVRVTPPLVESLYPPEPEQSDFAHKINYCGVFLKSFFLNSKATPQDLPCVRV